MAGFAIVMKFLFYGFVGFLGASITSVILFLHIRKKAREYHWSSGVVFLATVAPFLILFWAIASFNLHVWISNHIAHQDCGLGLSPDPWVRLPNGYILGSANTYDGYLAAPGATTDRPVTGPGYVRSIITLKWEEPYYVGTLFDFDSNHQRDFVYDIRTQIATTSNSNHNEYIASRYGGINGNDLKISYWAGAQTRTHYDPDSYRIMLAQNHHQWPYFVFFVLFLLGASPIVLWLTRIYYL